MKFYRYQTGKVESLGSFYVADLKLIEYVLLRETPKGYWISNNPKEFLHMKPVWVSKTAKKRYAYPTKEEALKSRIAINKRRIKFIERDLEITKQIIAQCEKLLETEEVKVINLQEEKRKEIIQKILERKME